MKPHRDRSITDCPGQFMEDEEPYDFTDEEMMYYANYSLVDFCDTCGNCFPITNYHDDKDFVSFNGIQFLCKKCNEK